ncbi:hypothetical protein HYY75_06500, partial [bacterium]|nr:hypothetical protein [bacterium]
MNAKNLVIGLNWVGDVLLSFPAIYDMGINEKVDIITRPHLSELYRLHPSVGKVWKVETKRPLWEFMTPLLAVRKMRYDKIVVLPRSFRSGMASFICGGKERIGYRGELRDLLLNKAVSLPQNYEKIHESQLHSFLVSKAGFKAFGKKLIPEKECLKPPDGPLK